MYVYVSIVGYADPYLWKGFLVIWHVAPYDLISVKLEIEQNDSTPCYCTPKCERTSYRSTISQAGVSKAMLNAWSVHEFSNPYAERANRLDDYVIMYKTNTSWGDTLYRLSVMYRDSREIVLGVARGVEICRGDMNRNNLRQSMKPCIWTFLDSITDITSQFPVWEKNIFYIHKGSTLYSHNLITYMASDIIRESGNVDNFVSEFMRHLHLIRIAAESSSTCNETRLINLFRAIQDMTKEANDSICDFYDEYKLFSPIVKTHPGIKSYQITFDDSTPEYIR